MKHPLAYNNGASRMAAADIAVTSNRRDLACIATELSRKSQKLNYFKELADQGEKHFFVKERGDRL